MTCSRISWVIALMASVTLVSAGQMVVQNSQLKPLTRAYRVTLSMYEYSNPYNFDAKNSECDSTLVFWPERHKCDVQIFLTVTNEATGVSSQAIYPEANKLANDLYANTDSIQEAEFKRTGSFASVQFKHTDKILVNLLILDRDRLTHDLIAKASIILPTGNLSTSNSIKFPIIKEFNGLHISLKVGLKCELDTCDRLQCYQPDSWRVCELDYLTCSHWPFAIECKRLAGNFFFEMQVGEIKFQESDNNCERSLSLCVVGLNDTCGSADFIEFYHSWPTTNSRNPPEVMAIVRNYLQTAYRLQRQVKLQFKQQKQCGNRKLDSENWHFDYDISHFWNDTKQRVVLDFLPNRHVELQGNLTIACDVGFHGMDCQQGIAAS